jgi:hypothetical protein
VDACLLVYSSDIASPELTLRAASQAVGEKLIVQEIQAGQPLAPMLDSLLDWARQLGAGWALLIDQDQQLKGPTAVEVAGEVARARQAGVSQVNCLNTHLDYARVRMLSNNNALFYIRLAKGMVKYTLGANGWLAQHILNCLQATPTCAKVLQQ